MALSDTGLTIGGVVSSYKNIHYTDTVQAKFDQVTADRNLRSFRIITKLSSAFLHVDNRLKKNTAGLKLPSEQMARCFTIVNYCFTKKSLVKRLYHTHPQRSNNHIDYSTMEFLNEDLVSKKFWLSSDSARRRSFINWAVKIVMFI